MNADAANPEVGGRRLNNMGHSAAAAAAAGDSTGTEPYCTTRPTSYSSNSNTANAANNADDRRQRIAEDSSGYGSVGKKRSRSYVSSLHEYQFHNLSAHAHAQHREHQHQGQSQSQSQADGPQTVTARMVDPIGELAAAGLGAVPRTRGFRTASASGSGGHPRYDAEFYHTAQAQPTLAALALADSRGYLDSGLGYYQPHALRADTRAAQGFYSEPNSASASPVHAMPPGDHPLSARPASSADAANGSGAGVLRYGVSPPSAAGAGSLGVVFPASAGMGAIATTVGANASSSSSSNGGKGRGRGSGSSSSAEKPAGLYGSSYAQMSGEVGSPAFATDSAAAFHSSGSGSGLQQAADYPPTPSVGSSVSATA
ncbi:hypothetical protein LPJ66_004592, partial [Kickxella alabastrina]